MWISIWRVYFPNLNRQKIKHVSSWNNEATPFGNQLFIWSHMMQSVLHICLRQISPISSKSTNNSSYSFAISGLQQRWDAHSKQSIFLLSSVSLMHCWKGASLSIFQGSPTNNVSPTSTPAKSSNAVPTLQPPPGESTAAAAAAEPAEE